MRCPFCREDNSRVVDSRTTDDGAVVRRRRRCEVCGGRFSTTETAGLLVRKRSGVTESFSRDKVVAGVRKACQGRPVTDDELAVLAQQVEEDIRGQAQALVDSHEVGRAILHPLRHLDVIAYLRFASVYKDFDDLGDFEAEIAALRGGAPAPGEEGTPSEDGAAV